MRLATRILASIAVAVPLACTFDPPIFQPLLPRDGTPTDAASAADAGLVLPDADAPAPDTGVTPDAAPSDAPAPDAAADAAPDATPLDADPPEAGPEDAPGPDSGLSPGTPFTYAPSNLDPMQLANFGGPLEVLLGTCTVRSAMNPRLEGDCVPRGSPSPVLDVRTQSDGSSVVVVAASSLRVRGGLLQEPTLRVEGQFPVIFLVSGDVELDGVLSAEARFEQPGGGARGRAACAAGAGANGAQGDRENGGGGGGGGAHGDLGGAGGSGATGVLGGRASTPDSNARLVPLRGGCPGGSGGDGDANGRAGGAGGGAVQISTAGNLTIRGQVNVSGGGGRGGERVGGGGGGGGSGGAIVLEGANVTITSDAQVFAKGGGGGEGGTSSRKNSSRTMADGANAGPGLEAAPGGSGVTTTGGDGGDGATNGTNATNGQPGSNTAGAGGGGGGGLGRIRVRASSCDLQGELVGATSRGC